MKRFINSSRRSKLFLVLTLVSIALAVSFLWPSRATAANSATISGQVFNDKNGNGVKEAGEAGLSGWTVQILDTSNQLLASQATDANGNYSITLPPVPVGSVTVRVREVVQAGWVQTTANPADIVVTSTGGTFSGRDFGNFQKISISGQTFNDLNGNGARDAGDPLLQGRTVFLDTSGNGAFDNGEPFTVTDASGNYSFTNLGPGTYKVREVLPAGGLQTTGNPADITAVSGTNIDGTINSGLNFGNFQKISISGQVYNDINGGGIKSTGEPGVVGWTVFLDTNGNSALDNGESSAVTDSQGNYSFINLGPGTYKVREVVQAGWTHTSANPGDVVAVSGAIVDPTSNQGLNFANFLNVTVSGKIFDDTNANGVLDAGEPGLSGWTLSLTTNNVPLSAVTDAQGNYSFTNLGPGAISVVGELRAGWTRTHTLQLFVPNSGSNTIFNLGEFKNLSFSGTVYIDQNGNAVRDTGEPGQGGLQVQLLNTSNQILAIRNSAADGSYNFGNSFGPGSYRIREVVPTGWLQTTTNPQDITLVFSGEAFIGRDFGNFQTISISGQVYNDLNGNGVREPGDNGLPGRTIFLDTNGNAALDNGEPSNVTDTQGSYSFTNLGPGAYKLREVVPIGWIQTTANPSDLTASSGTNVDGTINPALNFGNFLRATISGKVFDDTNGNGVLDAGEPGLSGWPVTLDVNNDHAAGSGEPFLLTDAQGNYIFDNLGPGTFGLLFGIRAGWRPTPGFPTAVTASGSNATVNAGFFKNEVISGTVYIDQNGNGARDAGEPGQGGWTVQLLDTSNQSLGVTNTAADGSYSFAFQGLGKGRIREVVKAGWVQTTAIPADITVTTSGTILTGVDIGNFQTATISGKVFDDTNANTALDPGEPALTDFTVFIDRNNNGLLDAGESFTSSDANGNYHFDFIGTQSLINGTLVLQIGPQTGWSPSYHVSVVTIASGSNIIMNLGEFRIGSVNGTVYNDHNGNGARDAGEPGLGGSTVQLINTVNQVVASQITAADGSYTLPIQTRGTYRVREVVQAGFTQTTTNPADIVATSGINQSGVDFGITQPAIIQFSQPNYTVAERGGSIQVTVTRTGDNSGVGSVDYATDDGSIPTVPTPCSTVSGKALERCDYTRSAGTLSFAPGETQKSFIVLVNDDSYAEGAETLQLVLSNPAAGMLGQQSTATLQITDDSPESSGNPLDDPSFFVRQHYHDFLDREPDQSGLDFWTGNITSCGSDDDCGKVRRIHGSAAFFLSIEFQETGYLVERLYKVAYGDATGNSTFPTSHTLPVPVVRLREFLRDTQEIGQGVVVGASGWEQLLETNKQAFCAGFVSRQRFTNAFPLALNAQQFVTQLDQNAGQALTDADKTQLIGIFGGPFASSNDAAKRALILRQVADNSLLQQREFNRAFVLMQFFGYLRRNPDDAQDTDHSGFDFWLTKLNQFNGDFVQAEMVKAFMTSAEYHQRFGP